MLNGLKFIHLFLLMIGIVSCGGGESNNTPAPEKLVVIDKNTQELVRAFATFVPEAMLQVNQFASSWIQTISADFHGQAKICNSTYFSQELLDLDNSEDLSAGDKIEFQFSNCLIPELLSEVTGIITISIQSFSEEDYSLLIETDFTVIDGEDSLEFNGDLNVDLSTTSSGHHVTLENNKPLVLTIEGYQEEISEFRLDETINVEEGTFSISSTFKLNSEALDGSFSCADTSNMTGLLFDLPSKFNIRCRGGNGSDLSLVYSPNKNMYANYSYGEDWISIARKLLWEGSIGLPVIIPEAATNFEHLYTELEYNDLPYRKIFIDKPNQLLYLFFDHKIQQFDMSSMSLINEIDIEQRFSVESVTLDANSNPRFLMISGHRSDMRVIELSKVNLNIINSYLVSDLVGPLDDVSIVFSVIYNLTSSINEPNKWGISLRGERDDAVYFIEVNNGLVVNQLSLDMHDSVDVHAKRVHYMADGSLLYLYEVAGKEFPSRDVKVSILRQEQGAWITQVENTFAKTNSGYALEYQDNKLIFLKGGYVLNREDLALKFETDARVYVEGFNWLLKKGSYSQYYEYYDANTGLLNRRVKLDVLADEYHGYSLFSAGDQYIVAVSDHKIVKLGIGHFVFAR